MSQLTLSITNLLLKFVTALLVLWIAAMVSPASSLSNWVVFTTAVVVAIVGVMADLAILPRLGNTSSLIADFVVDAVVLWAVPNLWHGQSLTFTTAIVSALVITVLEYTLHRFVLRADRLIDRSHQ